MLNEYKESRRQFKPASQNIFLLSMPQGAYSRTYGNNDTGACSRSCSLGVYVTSFDFQNYL